MSNQEFQGYDDGAGDYYEGEAEGDDGAGMDENLVGDEAGYEADVLGALVRSPFRRRRRQQGRQRGRGTRSPEGRRIYRQPPLPQQSFQPNMARLRSYLGMGTGTFPASAAAGTTIDLTVEPQESFRGERLIIDVTTTGTPGALPTVVGIFVGTLPQSPSVEQPAPAAMFARDATYSRLDMQIAFRATKLKVTLGVTGAVAAASSIICSVGFFGEWIR